MSKQIAIVLIRGRVGIRHDIKDTLDQLHLEKKHTCVLKEDSPSLQGMLRKIKDFATFGEVSADTIAALEKRKAKNGKVYFLAPPVGGFERKGIKKSFVVGGALGERGDAINTLLAKMI